MRTGPRPVQSGARRSAGSSRPPAPLRRRRRRGATRAARAVPRRRPRPPPRGRAPSRCASSSARGGDSDQSPRSRRPRGQQPERGQRARLRTGPGARAGREQEQRRASAPRARRASGPRRPAGIHPRRTRARQSARRLPPQPPGRRSRSGATRRNRTPAGEPPSADYPGIRCVCSSSAMPRPRPASPMRCGGSPRGGCRAGARAGGPAPRRRPRSGRGADEAAAARAGDRRGARAGRAGRGRAARARGDALPACAAAVTGRGETVLVVGAQAGLRTGGRCRSCRRPGAVLPAVRSRGAGAGSGESGERDHGQRPPQVIWRLRGGARRRLLDRGGRGLRPARPERRRQDDDGGDPRGLPGRATPARSVCSVTIPRIPAGVRQRIGVVLQAIGAVAEPHRPRTHGCSPATTRKARDVDEVIALVGLEGKAGTRG